MPLSAGERLGHFEVLSLIGKGGMGEVYLARDTKLKRDVAIKVLPESFAQDPQRMARFQREAEVLASLNHPNIATIHGVEDRALVMERVEGESLKGPMPFDEAWKIASQIAAALEYAHERGIVHRDLKPANIMITSEGVVKLLDFGLAKAFSNQRDPSASPENSPTLTLGATEVGVVLGTAAYMAPEQARGKAVDKRADIWSFGVVLHELLTGERLFTGEDAAEILAAVIHKQPDLAKAPPQARKLLRRCLEKDPKKRLRDIGDAWDLLEENNASIGATSSAPSRSRLGWVAWTVAGVFALAAATVSFVHFREKPPEARVLHTTILPPDDAAFDFTQGAGLLALSPDGKRIVFGARTADGKSPLWVRSLDVPTARPLAGTEGAIFPFWSPDSRFIAFFSDGKLKKIDSSGGPAIALADATLGRGGSWSPQGVILFDPGVAGGPLLRVSSAGGAATPVSTAIGSLPWFLPDGKHFLFQDFANGEISISAGSLDGLASKLVGTASSNALYAQGHLLFLREGTLMAQPFDAERLETAGEPATVAEQIATVLNSGRVGAFSVSATGMLAYRQGAESGGIALTWFDRSGNRGATVGDPFRILGAFQFSPDRKSVATGSDRPGDIWILDVARGLRTRLTFDPATDASPVWSPDGRGIVFRSNRKGHFDLYRKSADGGGAEELLYSDDRDKTATSWSPDGKFLLYFDADAKDRGNIWALPLRTDRSGAERGAQPKPFPVVQTAFMEVQGQFSPDGKWIAYQSRESGRYEVYVTPFPPSPSGAGGKRQISAAGGTRPRWRQDGKEIFYVGPENRLMAAEVSDKNGSIEVGRVQALSGIPNVPVNSGFDVSTDGQRFLFPVVPEQKSGEPVTLIENWLAML